MNRFDRAPEIDYLAKDFASFRQLMLDQIALLVPDWQERHPSDLGNVLIEVLAYAADYLSYTQDAIATEAYLGTARLRRSVRRHARLLDYTLHNGCNARTFVHIALAEDAGDYCLPQGTLLLAGVAGHDQATVLSGEQAASQMRDPAVQAFVTMHDVQLAAGPAALAFHVADRKGALLPRGTVSAFLVDSWSDPKATLRALDSLRAGDVLILEQRLDPASGLAAGVDPGQRHAVRLTQVEQVPLARARSDQGPAVAPPPVRITWDQADALPFDLPVGAYRTAGSAAAGRELSVALRNIVLVDHGAWVAAETLPPSAVDERYRPRLSHPNVTYAAGYDHALASRLPASTVAAQLPDEAQAVVDLVERRPLFLPDTAGNTPLLRGTPAGAASGQLESTHRWVQHRDLLSSDRTARVFVVETEDDGSAYLRFGFGGLGQGLAANATLVATYRVGNGTPGNVGRHAIAHLVSDDDSLAVMDVRNPLPVTSGIDAEPIEVARLAAPYAFQVPLSCITPDDYAAAALQLPHGQVRQARARIERTGNWQTVFVYAQRVDGQPLDAGFRQQLLAWLQPRALSGYQVVVRPPRPVSLDLQLRVWAVPHRFPNAVHRAVQLALGNGWQENGQPGFFHPDNLAMGQPIYWSQVIRAVMAVDGVARAKIDRFGRLDDTRALDPVPIDELEVARLDADPDYPECGTLQIDMVGTP